VKISAIIEHKSPKIAVWLFDERLITLWLHQYSSSLTQQLNNNKCRFILII